MSFLTQFETSAELENDGVWINGFADGMDIKIRRFSSPKVREIRERLEKPYAGLVRSGGKIGDEAQEEILLDIMAEGIIVDWRGKATTDFPCTPENKAAALKVGDFRNQVAASAMDRDTFKAELDEGAVKN